MDDVKDIHIKMSADVLVRKALRSMGLQDRHDVVYGLIDCDGDGYDWYQVVVDADDCEDRQPVLLLSVERLMDAVYEILGRGIDIMANGHRVMEYIICQPKIPEEVEVQLVSRTFMTASTLAVDPAATWLASRVKKNHE